MKSEYKPEPPAGTHWVRVDRIPVRFSVLVIDRAGHIFTARIVTAVAYAPARMNSKEPANA